MSHRKHQRKSNRRGVTLIFVVSLIVMFMLLGATFAVISANYLKSSRQNAQREVYNDPPQVVLERVLYTVLRGTTDRNTPAVFHDLGADIYGYQGFKASVTTPEFVANSGNVFLALRIDYPALAAAKYPTILGPDRFGNANAKLYIRGGRFDNSNYDIREFAGAYNGQVLTFISGPAQGISTRIVGYSYDPGNTPTDGSDDFIRFYIMVDKGDTSISNFFNPTNQAQPNPALVNADFLVNARPFTGKGAGEFVGGNVTPDQAAFIGATGANRNNSPLCVNRLADFASGLNSGYLQGGPNESYDVADYQNMFMAAVIQNKVTYNDISIIPSFHRPELIDYARTLPGVSSPADFRPYFLGPIQGVDANNQFPALNLGASAFTQQWQVDNDGDLIPDSIWIDFGLPVQTDASGRRYKPLGAVMCLDMDGRLNVNAQGTKYHQNLDLTPTNPPLPPLRGYLIDAQQSPVPLVDSAGNAIATQSLFNRGAGYGPPEISLRTAFVDNAEYYSVLYGNAGLPGRYGFNATPGIPGTDPLESYKLYGYPSQLVGNWYSSYLDINGRLAVGVDLNGAPRFDLPTIPDDYADNPYELNLLESGSGMISATAKDQPFSPAEAERFLRPNDIDSGILPDRLWRMSERLWRETSGTTRDRTYRTRRSLTTDSYDVPVPARDMLQELTNILSQPAPQGLDPALAGGASPPYPLAVSSQASGMLDRDLIMGLRMDINWAFGNGLDDNNNGVRDEASIPPDPANPGNPAPVGINESLMNEPLWGGSINFDHDIDGTTGGDADAYLARMHFARKLFVLALLTNPNITMDLDDGSAEDDGNPTQIEARKIIAQWVANVVDFRDTDSIMTPFEFDLNPFDGWHLDGYIGTDETTSASPPPPFQGQPSRYVVWGTERPELLIFETLAAHDRRTEDLDSDSTGKKTTDMNNPDEDFDQRVRPRGMFYLELYNPWSDTVQLPAELYSNVNGKLGVDLRRLNTFNNPVWRVLIVKDASKGRDPDTPSTAANDMVTAADKERSIYFTAPANIPADTHGQPFTPDNNTLNDMGIIGLQQYAVIGSSGTINAGVHTMPIGMRRDADLTTDLRIPQTRRIELEPSAGQCRIYQPDQANPANLTTRVRPCVAIPVTDLTLSEPIGGYTPASYGPNGLLESSYQPPIDVPLDKSRTDSTKSSVDQDGTVNNFREVHLQRLANPLAPFHAVTNPYRTIDSMSVDLTVFNGQDETDNSEKEADPGVSNWLAQEDIEFCAKERGEYEVDNNVAANRSRVIWEHEPNSPAVVNDTPLVGDQHYFSYNLGKNYPALGRKVETLGALNFPYDFNNPKFAGVPVAAPWLVWNNRPFISQLEMMIVPKGRSSRLLHDYSLNTGMQSYDYSTPANQNPTFGYLLNFFQSANGPNEGPDLHRLFEFTCVPSRFAGTESWLNPNIFTNLNQATGINGFNAPFNQISSYRYPGKINLNTITQREVWEGLFGRAEGANANNYVGGHDGPSWLKFVRSRAGYNGSQTAPLSTRSAVLNADTRYPTFFANPIRSPEDGNMVPQLMTSPNLLVRPDSECSVLRSDMVDTSGGINGARTPMFESTNLLEPYDDNNRNPYFRYQSLQRLGNLTTTHSNVYAIWITVGYFEVDGNGMLGKELGSDVGKVKRHRMFSMVDRSIPFAYEPGKNHNIERIILTKRFIE